MFDEQANLAYIRSQTEHVEAEAYAVQYPDIVYPELVPIDFSAPDFATAVTYVTTDAAGQAKWINGGAQDIPLVGLSRSESKNPVYSAAIGYDYTWEEIGQARMLGVPVTSDKAMAGRRIAEEMCERVTIEGDTTKNFQGLINNSSVTAVQAAAGVSTSRAWSAKTPLEILKDVNAALTGVWTGSKTVEMADTILLPMDQLALIAGTPMSVDNNKTVLAMVRETNIYTQMTNRPITIRGLLQLDGAGSGGGDRMIAYRRDKNILRAHIPMPHQFLPVQQFILQYIVPGVMRLGGTDVRRPGAMRYVDDI